MPVKVKICGITNLEDARVALDAGADALGFMFFAGSPRRVSLAQVAGIIATLRPICRAAFVGVFVNPSRDEVERALSEGGVDTLQFHGEETPEFIAGFDSRLPVAAEFHELCGCSRYFGTKEGSSFAEATEDKSSPFFSTTVPR